VGSEDVTYKNSQPFSSHGFYVLLLSKHKMWEWNKMFQLTKVSLWLMLHCGFSNCWRWVMGQNWRTTLFPLTTFSTTADMKNIFRSVEALGTNPLLLHQECLSAPFSELTW